MTEKSLITCPSCKYSAHASLPTSAVDLGVTCPKCRHRFRFQFPPPPIENRPTVTCPKCGVTQDDGEYCVACGIVYLKYRPSEPQEEPAVPPSAPHEKEAPVGKLEYLKWLLTDKSIGNVVWMVVLIIAGSLMASAYSKREAVLKGAWEHNQAEKAKAEAGPVRRSTAPPDEGSVLKDLRHLASKVREEGDRCLAECRLQAPRLEGDSGNGRGSNPALSEINVLYRIAPTGTRYEAYRQSIGQLIDTVSRINRLRARRETPDFQERLIRLEREYQERLLAVERNEPGDSGAPVAASGSS